MWCFYFGTFAIVGASMHHYVCIFWVSGDLRENSWRQEGLELISKASSLHSSIFLRDFLGA